MSVLPQKVYTEWTPHKSRTPPCRRKAVSVQSLFQKLHAIGSFSEPHEITRRQKTIPVPNLPQEVHPIRAPAQPR